MKTPQQSYQQLNDALGIEIYLKREDLHAYGSHKGRSIPHMIEYYAKKQNQSSFVISSSGNAARAAIKYVVLHNRNNPTHILTLEVYIGKKISEEKRTILEAEREGDPHITITETERPKQEAFTKEKSGEAINLRQSTDDTALEGYYELGKELSHIPNLSAIFIPTSSGTTAQALGTFFEKNKLHPQIHSVQTEACHPIAAFFDTDFTKTTSSLAQAIVDNVAHRKNNVIDAIQKSKGSGWVATDTEIHDAINLIKDTCSIIISPTAALSVAGLTKALKKGWKFDGPVVCLITGM